MRIAKNREFGRLKFDYQALKAGWGGYAGYDTWFARPINNARLASVATYHDCVPGLERELAAAGSLPAFYARADALAKLTRDAASGRRVRCAAVGVVQHRAAISGGASVSVRTREEDMLVRTDTEAPLDVTRLSCAVLRTASHGACSGT